VKIRRGKVCGFTETQGGKGTDAERLSRVEGVLGKAKKQKGTGMTNGKTRKWRPPKLIGRGPMEGKEKKKATN